MESLPCTRQHRHPNLFQSIPVLELFFAALGALELAQTNHHCVSKNLVLDIKTMSFELVLV